MAASSSVVRRSSSKTAPLFRAHRPNARPLPRAVTSGVRPRERDEPRRAGAWRRMAAMPLPIPSVARRDLLVRGRGDWPDRHFLELDDRILVVVLQADVARLAVADRAPGSPSPVFSVLSGFGPLGVEFGDLHAVDRREDAIPLERDLQRVPLAGLGRPWRSPSRTCRSSRCRGSPGPSP